MIKFDWLTQMSKSDPPTFSFLFIPQIQHWSKRFSEQAIFVPYSFYNCYFKKHSMMKKNKRFLVSDKHASRHNYHHNNNTRMKGKQSCINFKLQTSVEYTVQHTYNKNIFHTRTISLHNSSTTTV